MYQIGQNFTLHDVDQDTQELILVDDNGIKYRSKLSTDELAECGNCSEGFIQIDAFPHNLGFCSNHCHDQHNGDVCDSECTYCNDNRKDP